MDRDKKTFVLCVVGATLLHAILALSFPLSGDEAYYWDCSRHLAWSYFDQPPLVIWAIAACRLFLGETTLAVRMPAILSSLLIALFLLPTVRRLGGGTKDATKAYLLMHAMPLFFLGFFYTSTDIVMAAAFMAAVLASVSIARGERSGWWVFGIAVGVGFLGKFSAIVALGSLIGALTASSARADLRRPGPYLAAALSACLTAPAWIWGAEHGWDNFTFQLVERHSFKSVGLSYVIEFIAANLVLASPPLGLALASSWWLSLKRKEPEWRALSAGAIAPFVFFGFVGLRERIGPHWSAPGLMLMTLSLALISFKGKRLLIVLGAVMGLALTLTVIVVAAFPAPLMSLHWSYPGVPGRIATDQLVYLVGNTEIADEVERRLGPGELAASENYSAVHLVAFYTHGRVPTRLARITSGVHGLSSLYWYSPEELQGKDFLFFTESERMDRRLSGSFASIEEEEPFFVKLGDRIVRTLHFYRCRNLRTPEVAFSRLPRQVVADGGAASLSGR
jgi:4-amino-4-deoxy-L-arabinose transferase-like glycosyltransferase